MSSGDSGLVPGCVLSGRVSEYMPVRVLAVGIQATSALLSQTAQTVTTAAQTLRTTATTGLRAADLPVRHGVKALVDGLPVSTLTRNYSRGQQRAWIEVAGLDGPDGAAIGREVLGALSAHPGVASASLNRPLSRVVVTFEHNRRSPIRELCRAVEEAEKRCQQFDGDERPAVGGSRPTGLPGDGLLRAIRGAALCADAAALGVALTGRILRLPHLPITVPAVVSAMNYQPWLRSLLEDRIGEHATETALKLTTTVTNTFSLAASSLAVDALLDIVKAAESRAAAQAWRSQEPNLAPRAEHPEVYPPYRPSPRPKGPFERHARRAAIAQAMATAAVGAASRSTNTASTMALVSAPMALRTTRESFAAALGQGLAAKHEVLALRPESLRKLDGVDALLVDPRVLGTATLRVARVRGVSADELVPAWDRAHQLLEQSDLKTGWHPVPGIAGSSSCPGAEALVCPTHDSLASAVLAQARRSGVRLFSIDHDVLGELRPAFDKLWPTQDESSDDTFTDDTLTAALTDLQRDGHTVAVLSSAGAQALSSADVGLGIMPAADAEAPPWTADLLLPDLAAAWRVMCALPAAKAASQRGIAIASSASAFGALFLLPGVRGRGPGAATAGAAAGLLSGYFLARKALRVPRPVRAPTHEWHAMSVEQVRKVLPAPEFADSAEPAGRTLIAYAAQAAELGARPGRGLWQFGRAVRAELSDSLTLVLAAGSAASAVLGSPVDAVLIGSVLSGNAVLAASQRLRAETRLNRLLAQQLPPARKMTVDPGGAVVYTDIPAAQLQPGDVIEVRTHEVVTADARLIDIVDLEVDESALTGESLPVQKQVEATPGANVADRRCMLFAGTTVETGTAVALVTAVGADTQQRRAADLASGEAPAVGLQHQLGQLVNRAFPVSAAGGVVAGALTLLHRRGLTAAVANGIGLAVVAVPEGLPLVATLAQAASARRLTKHGALVRVPRSVEALGRLDVVCFDKTGTLSENRLQVTHVHAMPGFTREQVLGVAAHAAPNGDSHAHATDRAIVEAAYSSGALSGSARTAEAHLPFRSGRSFSASASNGELTVKGAPEVVLAACGGADSHDEATVRKMAADGLRVIAVARRQLTTHESKSLRDNEDALAELCLSGLSLAGFLGLSDTPREQAFGLLTALAERDVGIKLITGDHPITARAIARELGLPVTADQVISGAQWDALSPAEQECAAGDRVIFARMSPENKVQIVQTLERIGNVCAMVGDGSNDAAAIRAATVGIAVAARGSGPARTAADVVLADGRIEALLQAVDEGRELWRRVQNAVSVVLGGNAAELVFAVIGTAFTGANPLNTRQLLLVNMVTDGLPGAALAVSQPSGLHRGGRGPDAHALWHAVAIRASTTAAAATTAWTIARLTGSPRRASTVALAALVIAQLGQTLLESRTPLVVFTAAASFGAMATLISIPGVSQLLGCTPLGPIAWTQAVGSAASAAIAVPVAARLITGKGPQAPRSASRPAAPAHLSQGVGAPPQTADVVDNAVSPPTTVVC
jgi:cation-transporting P-type ATPase I